MTEPHRPAPGPEPHRPAAEEGPSAGGGRGTGGSAVGRELRAALAGRSTAEHVAAFEAEHARLRRELGTIDRL